MSDAYSAREAPGRILVRAPNPVGDLVMATASFADIRRSFPEAGISLCLKPGRADVVEGADYFDELLVDDSHRGARRFARLVEQIRRRRFDLAILFTHSFRTALAVALAGVPERVGHPKGGQGILLTRRVDPDREGWLRWRPKPMPDIYARLCAAAGVAPGGGRPRLEVTPACEESYRVRRDELGIRDGEPLVGVVPGASFGASKLWPERYLAELADRITERYGARTILLPGPGEKAIVAEIVSNMRTRPIDTSDRPLGLDLLKPFIRDLRLLVTMDSGPRHFAAAFGVPAIVIMGPTDPRWTAYSLERQDVVRHDVPCGPCHLEVCPIDHRCMTGILPDEVMERLTAFDARVRVF